MFKNLILATLLTGFVFFSAPTVSGQLLTEPSGDTAANCPSGYEGNCGNYTVDDFVVLLINASRIVLGLVGSLALIMFIYGGFMFLISGGSSESVGKAKKILIAAVIGLVIVFASFLIIKFVLGTMGIAWNGQKL